MKKDKAYQKARKKVQLLKDFYNHLISFVIINTGFILWWSNLFGPGETNFNNRGIYVILFFWGIGIFFHGMHVLYQLKLKNIIKFWEERKIREIMEKENRSFQDFKKRNS